MSWLSPVILADADVRLEPLAAHHARDLAEVVQEGNLHHLWYTNVPAPDQVHREIDRRLALQQAGSMLPFAVYHLREECVVGMTSYMNVDPQQRRVEIGGTWYAARLQRSGLNSACKMLLLSHAFETLECIAVEFRTHFFNRQSRAAIERLGAKLDGVLRHHLRDRHGVLRDTCVYSIIAPEWPSVRTNLEWHKARHSNSE